MKRRGNKEERGDSGQRGLFTAQQYINCYRGATVRLYRYATHCLFQRWSFHGARGRCVLAPTT